MCCSKLLLSIFVVNFVEFQHGGWVGHDCNPLQALYAGKVYMLIKP